VSHHQIFGNGSHASEEDGELLTVQELAEALKVKPSWVYGHKDLPCIWVGRYPRYEKDAVLDYLRKKNGR
jgi:hypothetical protein